MVRLLVRGSLVLSCALLVISASADQLRIGTWNISNYNGSDRAADIQNSLFGNYQGRTFAPDVLFGQEILSNSAANTLKNLMNTATGSSGDYDYLFGSAGNSGSQTAIFYRTSLVSASNPFLIAPAGGTSANPRDVFRFDFTLTNNLDDDEVFSVYNLHMKAGSTTEDQNRRQVEAEAVRTNANALADNHQVMVLGDFNIQSSNQTAYQTLTTAGSNDRGQALDPIGTTGSWNNSIDYRFVHTQDPAGAGGMDDRHDQILLGGDFNDGFGTEYVGNFGQTFSTTTWNDPDHSYTAWGNDGTSFNSTLTVSGNTMVGDSIAQSLVDSAGGAGHLPVFLDIDYQAVPEPATLVLATAGLAALVARRKRKSS